MNSLCLLPNDMEIHICFSDMKNKKYKDQKMKEIVSTFCAVLNSQGGRVTLELKSGSKSDVNNLKRAIEQRLSNMLGFSVMHDHINLVSSSTEGLTYTVEGVYSLCTMNYNLYVAGEKNIIAVLPTTPITEIKEMLSPEKRIVEVEELVKKRTHHKEFVIEQNISSQLQETKEVELKCLKDQKSKCISLGDRMTNKTNKLTKYVSGFARNHGGHIYYGIEDDGVVKGEFVEDKEEIIKKVSTAINKMFWPPECDGPRRGKHWEIFFEPVNDVGGHVVPSTFVIVIYIAHCAGSVFTEEPESYHIVQGEVKKIEFNEWRERILQKIPCPKPIARGQWSSEKTKIYYHSFMEKMINLKNSGNEKAFERFVNQAEIALPLNSLAILSQRVAFACRRNELEKAKSLIKEYDVVLLSTSDKNENFLLFQCLSDYIKSIMYRSAANYRNSYDLVTNCLQNIEFIAPGICCAWFYLQAASLLSILAREQSQESQDREEKIMLAKIYSGKGLEHLSCVSRFSKTVADVQQNIYIHLASLYLACSLNGEIDLTADVCQDDITSAKNCLIKVEKLILNGHPLTFLRQIQYCLAQSNLVFRQSQLPIHSTLLHGQLETCLHHSYEALALAKKCGFGEMVRYSSQQIACVKGVVSKITEMFPKLG